MRRRSSFVTGGGFAAVYNGSDFHRHGSLPASEAPTSVSCQPKEAVWAHWVAPSPAAAAPRQCPAPVVETLLLSPLLLLLVLLLLVLLLLVLIIIFFFVNFFYSIAMLCAPQTCFYTVNTSAQSAQQNCPRGLAVRRDALWKVQFSQLMHQALRLVTQQCWAIFWLIPAKLPVVMASGISVKACRTEISHLPIDFECKFVVRQNLFMFSVNAAWRVIHNLLCMY